MSVIQGNSMPVIHYFYITYFLDVVSKAWWYGIDSSRPKS